MTIYIGCAILRMCFITGYPLIIIHAKNTFEDSELDEVSTIRKFRIVQKEGKRKGSRKTRLYIVCERKLNHGFSINSNNYRPDQSGISFA
jgi:hypothetical protein